MLLLKLFSNLCYIYLVWTEDTFFQSAFYLIIVFNVQVQARMEDLDPDPQPSMIWIRIRPPTWFGSGSAPLHDLNKMGLDSPTLSKIGLLKRTICLNVKSRGGSAYFCKSVEAAVVATCSDMCLLETKLNHPTLYSFRNE